MRRRIVIHNHFTRDADITQISEAKLLALYDKLSSASSANITKLIAAGRSMERGGETYAKGKAGSDPLSVEYAKIADALREVVAEKEARRRYQGSLKPIKKRTLDAISASTREALVKAKALDILKYHKGLPNPVKLVDDSDNWNAHYDFAKDEIVLQNKFEAKDYLDKVQILLHEMGHRGQVKDARAYKAFQDAGLGSVKNFLAMCNKTHRDDYAKNGIDNPDEEAFAESYARFALGLPMPKEIRTFWMRRIAEHDQA